MDRDVRYRTLRESNMAKSRKKKLTARLDRSTKPRAGEYGTYYALFGPVGSGSSDWTITGVPKQCRTCVGSVTECYPDGSPKIGDGVVETNAVMYDATKGQIKVRLNNTYSKAFPMRVMIVIFA
jgi:hypothetical protein